VTGLLASLAVSIKASNFASGIAATFSQRLARNPGKIKNRTRASFDFWRIVLVALSFAPSYASEQPGDVAFVSNNREL
jgi:hypothetical protein